MRRRKLEPVSAARQAGINRRALQVLPLLKRAAALEAKVRKIEDRIVALAAGPGMDDMAVYEEISELFNDSYVHNAPIDLRAARIVVRGRTKKETAAMIERLEREIARRNHSAN